MKIGSNQTTLFIPNTLEELVADDSIARKIKSDVDSLDLTFLEKEFNSNNRGRPPYNVYDLLSATLYGITQGITSTRKLAKASKDSVTFMWLLGCETPNHATYNNFQHRLARHSDSLMQEQIKLLLKQGYIDLNEISIDGTKVMSKANKYRSVYRGTVGYHESNMETKIIDSIMGQLLFDANGEDDFEGLEIPDEISEIITSDDPNNRRLTNKKSKNRNYIPKISIDQLEKIKSWIETLEPSQLLLDDRIKYLSKNIDTYIERKEKYNTQREKLGDRNSYASTDEDASFMRLKDDSFDSKILSPAYNVQMAQNNGFIITSLLSNQASDTRQLKDVVKSLDKIGGREDNSILMADAGYGSLENYEILKEAKIRYIIPYMMQRFEQKRKYVNNPCTVEKFEIRDKEYALCPGAKKLKYEYTKVTRSVGGFETYKDIYITDGCGNCALNEICTKGKGRKTLYYDKQWHDTKKEIREQFKDVQVKRKYKTRSVIEQNFGIVKHNFGLSRFRHTGIDINTIIWNLYTIAANMSRAHSIEQGKISKKVVGKNELPTTGTNDILQTNRKSTILNSKLKYCTFVLSIV